MNQNNNKEMSRGVSFAPGSQSFPNPHMVHAYYEAAYYNMQIT